MRVLIVSEDAAERSRASSALALRGELEIVEAATAGEARALSGDVDLIVMDGDLSPQGGYSVLYEIRASHELHGTTAPPAIVMMDRDQDRWLATWAGAEVALLKPVDSFALADHVRALVAV